MPSQSCFNDGNARRNFWDLLKIELISDVCMHILKRNSIYGMKCGIIPNMIIKKLS